MVDMFYTYLHCKPDGTPFYVGKGKHNRCYDLTARNNLHEKIVNKYGRKNILIYRFFCESEEIALKDEIQQISQLRKEGYKLCNFTDGGDGISGYKHTEETKELLRKLSTGIKQSESTIEKRKEKLIGKKRTLEQCSVISKNSKGRKTRLGKKHNELTLIKMRDSAKLRGISRKTLEKAWESTRGKPWSKARREAQEKRNKS